MPFDIDWVIHEPQDVSKNRSSCVGADGIPAVTGKGHESAGKCMVQKISQILFDWIKGIMKQSGTA